MAEREWERTCWYECIVWALVQSDDFNNLSAAAGIFKDKQ